MSDYAFFCAAEEGDLELVSSMLAAEPDLLHAKDCSDLIDWPTVGWTALHFACSEGKLDVVELLIDAGADIEAKSAYGGTAIGIAAGSNNVYIVDALVRADANIYNEDWMGRIAMNYTSSRVVLRYLEIAEYRCFALAHRELAWQGKKNFVSFLFRCGLQSSGKKAKEEPMPSSNNATVRVFNIKELCGEIARYLPEVLSNNCTWPQYVALKNSYLKRHPDLHLEKLPTV